MCLLLCMVSAYAAEIVENGRKPVGKAMTIKFTKDLSFGADGEEDHLIWGLSTTKIIPDDRGHMFITDPKEKRIYEFGPDGSFIRTAAVPGQGPGELQGILGMAFIPGEGFIVLDAAMMSLPWLKSYDNNMKYLSQKMPQGKPAPFSFVFSPKGNLLGGNFFTFDMGQMKMTMKTGVMDREFNLKIELSSLDQPFPNFTETDGGVWAKYIGEQIKNGLAGIGVYGFGPNGEVYTAMTNQYEITRWNADLTAPLFKIRRKYKPIPNNEKHLKGIVEYITESLTLVPQFKEIITPAVLNRALELADAPPAKNPLFGLVTMEDGTLLVIHDIDLGTRENVADIFNPEGKFLGQVRMPDFALMSHDSGTFQPRMIFRNGFAYTITTDEYGDLRAHRLKYELVEADGSIYGLERESE